MIILYQNHFLEHSEILVFLFLQNGHNKVNDQLQKLSSFTQTNFVSTKEFKDKRTGKIRSNLMKDFVHYNDWGVKILAQQIKKSLYSIANIAILCGYIL